MWHSRRFFVTFDASKSNYFAIQPHKIHFYVIPFKPLTIIVAAVYSVLIVCESLDEEAVNPLKSNDEKKTLIEQDSFLQQEWSLNPFPSSLNKEIRIERATT